jgi:hypothetical protein
MLDRLVLWVSIARGTGGASGQNIGGEEGHGVSVVQGRLSRFSHEGKGMAARIITDL